mmetsp:Transcript_150535/g.483990  ORF Transcript_150535/g.483990 Transcript_150535/m.483990 type:complete len:207 (-) Transcript_150535:836-1456(-)
MPRHICNRTPPRRRRCGGSCSARVVGRAGGRGRGSVVCSGGNACLGGCLVERHVARVAGVLAALSARCGRAGRGRLLGHVLVERGDRAPGHSSPLLRRGACEVEPFLGGHAAMRLPRPADRAGHFARGRRRGRAHAGGRSAADWRDGPAGLDGHGLPGPLRRRARRVPRGLLLAALRCRRGRGRRCRRRVRAALGECCAWEGAEQV